MITNLNQEIEAKNKSVTKVSLGQQLFDLFKKKVKNFSPLEWIVYSLNLLLTMIIFGSGIRTMIEDVVGSFPISDFFYLPVGFILMGIVVVATHHVTNHSAELCFHWSRYALPYKILLPTTNVLLLVFCWSVQTEGGEILVTQDIDEQIRLIEQDSSSTNLHQIDQNLATIRTGLAKANMTIQFYDSLRKSRTWKTLNKRETKIYLATEKSKDSYTTQLSSFTQNRVTEVNRIADRNDKRLAQLEQKRQERIEKGKGKAGLAEGILVFTAFFMMAYRNRFASQTPETQDLIQEFPKGLSLEEREEMVKHFEFLNYDRENKTLLINYNHQKYYIEMEGYVANMRTCKSKLESTNRSSVRENKIRNLSYYEHVLSLTGLNLAEVQEEFKYSVLNLDYWKSTTDTDMNSDTVPLNNRYIPLNTS